MRDRSAGAGNQSTLEAMADSRLAEELGFRAHNPIYFKADGHYEETTGQVARTFKGYEYVKASAGGALPLRTPRVVPTRACVRA